MDVIIKKETATGYEEKDARISMDISGVKAEKDILPRKNKKQNDFREETRLVRIVVNFLVFLIPLFFLPITFEFYQFNKIFLLFFGVTLMLILTLWRFVKAGEIRIARTPIDFFVLAYVFFAFLSALFSKNGVSGFLGFYGRFSGSFLEIFLMALFWWLFVQNFYFPKREKNINGYFKNINSVVGSFLLSNLFITLFTIFSLFGLGKYLPESGFANFLNSSVISPTGLTFQGLAVYFSAILVFLISFIVFSHTFFTKQKSRNRFRFLCWPLLIFNFAILILVDFWVAWVVLIVGLCLIFGAALIKRIFKEKSNWLALPILIAILAFILLGFSVHNFFDFSVTEEIMLSPSHSLRIIGNSFISSPILGSGPGNFWHNFNAYKGEEFMDSPFWQLRFSRSHFGLLENLSSVGIFGFVSLVGVFGMFLLITYALFKNNFDGSGKYLLSVGQDEAEKVNHFLVFSVGVAALLLAGILYADNMVLTFSLWLFLALAILSWDGIKQGVIKTSSVDLKKFQELSVIFLSGFIILVLVVFAFWWQASRIYLADVFYRKAISGNMTLDQKIEHLEKAVKFVDYRESYLTGLSRGYMARAEVEFKKLQNERDDQRAKTDIALAIQSAKKATESNAESVAAWESLGSVYRDLGGLVGDAYVWAEDSFRKAVSLDPANPFLYVSLGKVQMVLALSGDSLNKEKMEEALSNIKKARGLKEGYLGAYLNEALVLESQGKFEDAIRSLEDYLRDFISVGRGVWQNQSEVADFFFQLGRFYYNNNDMNKAAINFIQAVSLAPFHSNARYSLGVSLEKMEMINEAIEQYEIVLQLNPGNQQLIDKINALKVR